MMKKQGSLSCTCFGRDIYSFVVENRGEKSKYSTSIIMVVFEMKTYLGIGESELPVEMGKIDIG